MPAQEEAAPAIVCDMTSAHDTGDQRVAEYARLFDTAFVSRERTPDGVRWRLRADDGVEAWSRDLADREMACCAFLSITVKVDGEHVVWDATTIDAPMARAVLALYYDLPEKRTADAEAVWEQSRRPESRSSSRTDLRPALRRPLRSGRAERVASIIGER